MADLNLVALRQLSEVASPVPWTWQAVGEHGYPQRIVANDDGLVLVAKTYHGDVDSIPPDADLIVAARNALPDLLDEIEKLEAVRTWVMDHVDPLTLRRDPELVGLLDVLEESDG